MWHHVAPDVEITTIPVVDTPSPTPVWRATLDEVRVICYEYLAIAYNWYAGRLSFR